MKKMFMGLLVVTLLLGVSSIGFAHGHRGGGGGCGGGQYYDCYGGGYNNNR